MPKQEKWADEFDQMIGRPISAAVIKEFIRELLKQKHEETLQTLRKEKGN